MKLQYQSEGGYWTAEGHGPMRGIVVEAESRQGAREGWMECYGRQYAESESLSGFSVSFDSDDIRTNNYKQGE